METEKRRFLVRGLSDTMTDECKRIGGGRYALLMDNSSIEELREVKDELISILRKGEDNKIANTLRKKGIDVQLNDRSVFINVLKGDVIYVIRPGVNLNLLRSEEENDDELPKYATITVSKYTVIEVDPDQVI